MIPKKSCEVMQTYPNVKTRCVDPAILALMREEFWEIKRKALKKLRGEALI